MSARQIALGLLFLVGIAAIITAVAYFVNIRLFTGNQWGSLTPHEAFFFEGVLFLMVGFLLLVGRGGIDIRLLRASTIWGWLAGPKEDMREDRPLPLGFIRLALLLLITGLLMLVLYILS